MTFDKKQALNSIQQLLKLQSLGVLATQGEKYPYSTLVGFAASDDLKTLFLLPFGTHGNIKISKCILRSRC
jgi:hypothetical protein